MSLSLFLYVLGQQNVLSVFVSLTGENRCLNLHVSNYSCLSIALCLELIHILSFNELSVLVLPHCSVGLWLSISQSCFSDRSSISKDGLKLGKNLRKTLNFLSLCLYLSRDRIIAGYYMPSLSFKGLSLQRGIL